MIVALASQVQENLKLVSRLERDKNEAENIQATLVALHEANKLFAEVSKGVQILAARLPAATITELQDQADKIATDVDSSLSAFAENRRQVQKLRTIQQRIQQLKDRVVSAWKEYVANLLDPQLEVLALVQSLPEIVAQQDDINRLVLQLRSRAEHLPQSSATLGEIDARLGELQQRLAAVRQLSPEVKSFLDKVRAGTATIVDLTPTVLDWCCQGEHAKAFAIRFVTRKDT